MLVIGAVGGVVSRFISDHAPIPVTQVSLNPELYTIDTQFISGDAVPPPPTTSSSRRSKNRVSGNCAAGSQRCPPAPHLTALPTGTTYTVILVATSQELTAELFEQCVEILGEGGMVIQQTQGCGDEEGERVTPEGYEVRSARTPTHMCEQRASDIYDRLGTCALQPGRCTRLS